MMNYISLNELADRITSGRIKEETTMKTYTLKIKTVEFDGKVTHIRTLAFESDNGAEDIQKEIEGYQEMGINYDAELTLDKPGGRDYTLTYTEKN